MKKIKLHMDTQIFIASHKSYAFPAQSEYIPIWAGSALSNDDINILRDDTGKNISKLNKNFCELTVLYWMWKNCLADIQGLVHYRRYFMNQEYPNLNIDHLNKLILDASKLRTLLPSEKDIILPVKQNFGKYRYFLWLRKYRTVYQQYQLCHFEKDWHILELVIKENYPAYMDAFNKVKHATEISCCNMFIAHKRFINQYCTWLFDILFAVEKKLDLTSYNVYQQRVFGFLAERLLNVYVCHHQDDLNIKYLETTFLE